MLCDLLLGFLHFLDPLPLSCPGPALMAPSHGSSYKLRPSSKWSAKLKTTPWLNFVFKMFKDEYISNSHALLDYLTAPVSAVSINGLGRGRGGSSGTVVGWIVGGWDGADFPRW